MHAPNRPRPAGPRRLRTDAAMAAAVLLLGIVLTVTGRSLVFRWRTSSARHQSLGLEDQLGIAATTAGLIVILWWALSVVLAIAAACLERSGNRYAASVAGRYAPAFILRLALAAFGLHLFTAPLALASIAPTAPETSASATAPAAWAPTAAPAGAGTSAQAPAPLPGPAPDAGESPPTVGVTSPQWQPLRPVVDPGPLAGTPRRDGQAPEQAGEVVVRSGDSLWSLSATRLGPFASDLDVALDWPRLYQANREIIGANPDLLYPGQVLKLPPME